MSGVAGDLWNAVRRALAEVRHWVEAHWYAPAHDKPDDIWADAWRIDDRPLPPPAVDDDPPTTEFSVTDRRDILDPLPVLYAPGPVATRARRAVWDPPLALSAAAGVYPPVTTAACQAAALTVKADRRPAVMQKPEHVSWLAWLIGSDVAGPIPELVLALTYAPWVDGALVLPDSVWGAITA